MTVKNLFIFDAIVCLIFGLSLIFSPQALANLLLIDPALTDGAISTFRSYGIILLSAAISLFYVRNSLPSTARKGFLIFITISGILITINNIQAILTGIENNNGWGVFILISIISARGLMLLLKEKRSAS